MVGRTTDDLKILERTGDTKQNAASSPPPSPGALLSNSLPRVMSAVHLSLSLHFPNPVMLLVFSDYLTHSPTRFL